MSANGSRYVTLYAAGPLWVMFDRARIYPSRAYHIDHLGSHVTGSAESCRAFLTWLGGAL